MEWTLHVRSGGLEEWQCGGEFGNMQARSRRLNGLLQAMCLAVINCTMPDLGNDMHNQLVWHFPLAFDARRETRDEQELRVMLASVGEENQQDALP